MNPVQIGVAQLFDLAVRIDLRREQDLVAVRIANARDYAAPGPDTFDLPSQARKPLTELPKGNVVEDVGAKIVELRDLGQLPLCYLVDATHLAQVEVAEIVIVR